MAAYCYNGSFTSLLRNYHPYPHSVKETPNKKPEPKRSVNAKGSRIQGWTSTKEETSECFDEWCSKTKSLKERPKSGKFILSWSTDSRCPQISPTFEKESLNRFYVSKTFQSSNLNQKNEIHSAPTSTHGAKSSPNVNNTSYTSISNNPFDKTSNKVQRTQRLQRSNTNGKPQLFKITCSIVTKDKNLEGPIAQVPDVPSLKRETLHTARSDSVLEDRGERLRAPLSRSSCYTSINDDIGRRPMTMQPPIVEREQVDKRHPQDDGKIPEIVPKEIVLKSRAEQINYIHSRINALESELTRSRLLPGVTSALAMASDARPCISRTGSYTTMSHHPPATPGAIRQATSRLLSYNKKYCLGSFPSTKHGPKGADGEESGSGPENAAFSKPATPPRLKMAKKDKQERQRTVIPSKITVQEAIPEIGMTWNFQRFPDKTIPDSAITGKMKLF